MLVSNECFDAGDVLAEGVAVQVVGGLVLEMERLPSRIGSIRPLFKLRTLCARDTSHQSLVQTATYPTEFEPQIPSNSASAPSQAHLPMLLTQPGRSSIQPLHRPPAALTMQPAAHAGSCA